jgi:hypothetical protein
LRMLLSLALVYFSLRFSILRDISRDFRTS